jgi:hypothetical protein
MSFQPNTFYSFCYSADTEKVDWLNQIKKTSLNHFEISGTFFESAEFDLFYQEVFKAGKYISSVKDIIPTNVSRNWSSSSESIKSEILEILIKKIRLAGRYNIKYLNLDLGLDSIHNGYEIQEITVRTQLLEPLIEVLEEEGVTICQPIRFPKTFPGSEEWKFAIMLVSSVMHARFCIEINIFPSEVNNSKPASLLKNIYYSAKLIRFRYDSAVGANFTSDMQEFWAESLRQQGFSGDLVFCPTVEGEEMLKIATEDASTASALYVEEDH